MDTDNDFSEFELRQAKRTADILADRPIVPDRWDVPKTRFFVALHKEYKGTRRQRMTNGPQYFAAIYEIYAPKNEPDDLKLRAINILRSPKNINNPSEGGEGWAIRIAQDEAKKRGLFCFAGRSGDYKCMYDIYNLRVTIEMTNILNGHEGL